MRCSLFAVVDGVNAGSAALGFLAASFGGVLLSAPSGVTKDWSGSYALGLMPIAALSAAGLVAVLVPGRSPRTAALTPAAH